jgi:phosphoserine phosphatase RsbU/P
MRAGQPMGAEALVIYLVDYAQTYLAPFAGETTPPRERVMVDGTLAGRAFALGEICDSSTGLWVPMMDCGHRIGVLEVVAPNPISGGDRDTYRAIATALAQTIATRDVYGDAIEHLRRGLPMQLATEIVWNLLPPLTLTTASATVTGILEPCYEIGGDAFDYAINGNTVHVALFDAVGHGIDASAMTTIAINAYRNARRCGLDLLDSCRSIDKWISMRYPEQFVTGALAELDVATGVVRSISAGHPSGLLLRDGALVRDLPGPTSMPLGLSTLVGTPPEIVTEYLEPGDNLLFYTDGMIEARNEKGEFFGRDRLVDFVMRTLADRVSAPETLRRVIRAILEHQHEHLQDDATAVLIHWTGRPERP